MGFVEPGGPMFMDPKAFRAHGPVAGADDAAPLTRGCRAQPEGQVLVLGFAEVGEFIQGNQVVGAALIAFDVPFMGAAAELNRSLGPWDPPQLLLGVVAIASPENARGFVLEALDLGVFPPKDDGTFVLSKGGANDQRAFATARTSAEEQLIRWAVER